MKPVTNSDLDQRVSSLEANVVTLTSSVDNIGRSIDSLRTELSQRGRMPVATLAAVAGVVVVLIGAIGGAFLAPVHITLAYHAGQIAGLQEKGGQHDKKLVYLKENSREKESQFTFMDRMQRIMYKKIFGEELPPLTWKYEPNGD